MLTLDFGDADVAKYLVGEEGDDASIAWLTDILSTGGRMMRSDCAFVSFEAQPNQISKVRLEQGQITSRATASDTVDYSSAVLRYICYC
jgi:hypothetical protein